MRRKGGRAGRREVTLWSAESPVDAQMLAYTIADDPVWDARLVTWDVLGSLGHAEGLRRSRLVTPREFERMQRALRSALRAAERGELVIGPQHEDVHSAVEFWLTERYGSIGERIHVGRSRNDQVVCDLRLYLKNRILTLHGRALELAEVLLDFARANREALWPG